MNQVNDLSNSLYDKKLLQWDNESILTTLEKVRIPRNVISGKIWACNNSPSVRIIQVKSFTAYD